MNRIQHFPSRTSKRYGFAQDSIFHIRANPTFGYNVDLTPQQFLQVQFEAGLIQ